MRRGTWWITGVVPFISLVIIATSIHAWSGRQIDNALEQNREVITTNNMGIIANRSAQSIHKQWLRQEAQMLKSTETLVFTTGEYPPFVYVDGDEVTGLSCEVVERVLEEMGEDSKIVIEPWNRGMYELTSGNRFGAFPYVKTQERLGNFAYSKLLYPPTLSSNFFIGYNRTDQVLRSIRDWSDLEGYRLGGVYGYFYFDEFRARRIEVDVSASEIECLQKLIDGKIDFALFNPLVVNHLSQRNFPEEAEKFGVTDFQLNPDPLGDHLMLRKDDPRSGDFLRRFNDTLMKLEVSGEIQKIVDRYSQPALNK